MCNVIQNALTEPLFEGLWLFLGESEGLSVVEDLLLINEDADVRNMA